MDKRIIERLEAQLIESVNTAAVPMGMSMGVSVDPDTFSGPAPKNVSKKGACGCSCEACRGCKSKMEGAGGDCGCGCSGAQNEGRNRQPVNQYTFTKPVNNQSDARLPLGYTHTKFLSLLQKMVAPLPVINEPGRISVVASPALASGLKTLARREGMKVKIKAVMSNEAHCS